MAEVVSRLAFDELEEEFSAKNSHDDLAESNKKIIAMVEILTSLGCMGE